MAAKCQPSVIELAGIAPEARWMIPDQRSSQPKELPMILEISKAEKQHSHQVGGLSLNPSQKYESPKNQNISKLSIIRHNNN
jgi:hypothetical protein